MGRAFRPPRERPSALLPDDASDVDGQDGASVNGGSDWGSQGPDEDAAAEEAAGQVNAD